jgi:hypothetical protein
MTLLSTYYGVQDTLCPSSSSLWYTYYFVNNTILFLDLAIYN